MKCSSLFQIFYLTFLIVHVSSHSTRSDAKDGDSGFDYNNPNKDWSEKFKTCGGIRQSPINIEPRHLNNAYLPSLEFLGYNSQPLNLKIENTGHSVQLSGKWQKGRTPSIRGGPLNNVYEFAQLHFHWGSHDNTGSEHTIRKQKFPLELHVVHWNRKYGNSSEAGKYSDGLAVLGYLVTLDNEYYYQNRGVRNIISAFTRILSPNQATDLGPFPLSAFDLGIIAQEYVTYLGSLTTPPCSESVTWLVAGQNLRGITRKELNSFRQLQLDHHDDHNYRPTQPLNDRSVYHILAY